MKQVLTGCSAHGISTPSQLGQSLVFIYNAHPTLEGLEAEVYNASYAIKARIFITI